MKVLLYFENQDSLKKSGIGRALKHQMMACENASIPFTISKKDNFDLAHINTYFGKSYRLAKKCKKVGIPLIVHGHSTIEDFKDSFRCWKLMSIYYYAQLKKLYSLADLIVTPTIYSKDLIKSYKWNDNVINLSNGINLKEYEYNKESIEMFKKHFNINGNEKVVIGVGLPFKRKGIDDFIEVARSFPNIKFIWFGNLQKILTQHYILKCMKNKPDNVIFPGYIAGDIIKGAYHYASAMFFPSHEETEGIVVLEALASKTPLLVRDIGVYKDWLINNKNCYMGKNNEEFIEKLNFILNNDNSKITEEGYKVAQERDLSIIGDKIKEIYTNLYNLKNKK